MEWEDFKKQPYNKNWIKMDDLSSGQLKEISKGCRVTMKETMIIVQDISVKFNLSPRDAFKVFQGQRRP